MPVGPFVAALRTPVVQMMGNAAVRQDPRHLVGRPAVLPRAAAGRELDVATPVLVQKPRVTLVGHVVFRVIEVEVVVVHPVHRILHGVDARERVAAFHMIGMLEEGVGRVIGAERRSQRGNRDARRLALGVDEWENFVRHIGIVLRLHPTPMEGVRSLVLERIVVHAVDGEDADSPLFQVPAKGADHALTFLLPFVAAARREGEEGQTVMAVDGDAHVAIETVRVQR